MVGTFSGYCGMASVDRRCRIEVRRLIRETRQRAPGQAFVRDESQGSPGLKGSSLPAGTLSSAMLNTMATVT